MKQVYTQLKASKLIKDNSVAFFGALLAAGLNYLFYPVLGRFLTTAQFGDVQVLATLTVQAGLVFGLARIAIIGEVLLTANKQQAQKVIEFSERLLLQLSFVLTILAALTAPFVASKLQIASVVPLYIVMPSLALSAVRSSRDSFLRAYGHFGYSAVADIVTALSKLVIAAVLAAIGLGTAGALLGLTGAYAVATILVFAISMRLGLRTNLKGLYKFQELCSVFKKGTVSKKGVTTLGVSSASLLVVVISSIDTVFAKLALPPETAGLYSGVSVVGNIALFATGSIAGVLLASVSRQKPHAQNTRAYKLSALLTAGIGGVIVLGSVAAPQLIVTGMLGSTYAPLSTLLPSLAVAMFAMAGINLIVSYHIAMRDVGILVVAGTVFVIVVASLTLGHASPQAIAASFLRANVLSLILCLGWTLYWHKKVLTL